MTIADVHPPLGLISGPQSTVTGGRGRVGERGRFVAGPGKPHQPAVHCMSWWVSALNQPEAAGFSRAWTGATARSKARPKRSAVGARRRVVRGIPTSSSRGQGWGRHGRSSLRIGLLSFASSRRKSAEKVSVTHLRGPVASKGCRGGRRQESGECYATVANWVGKECRSRWSPYH